MNRQPPTDLPASIQARLLRRARATGEDHQFLFLAFVAERFLYRLGQSNVRDRFVLKGAMLLRAWSDQPYRATRDLDLLRRGEGSHESIRSDVETICKTELEPDGLAFDSSSIEVKPIRAEDEYVGTRLTLVARSGKARVRFQIDVGVGDAVWPEPERRPYPTLLDFHAPEVLMYSPESVVAEKLEAIIVLGARNSRIKDFFDLQYLGKRFAFDGATLTDAIRRTLDRRGTPIPAEEPIGLTDGYWREPGRSTQVVAFTRRTGLNVDAGKIAGVTQILRKFLLPILEKLRIGESFVGTWDPGGPWRP